MAFVGLRIVLATDGSLDGTRWDLTDARGLNDLNRVSVSSTEISLVTNAGLVPAAVLAQRIGLGDLLDQRLRLASEGAISGAKAVTVVGSMPAGAASMKWTSPAEWVNNDDRWNLLQVHAGGDLTTRAAPARARARTLDGASATHAVRRTRTGRALGRRSGPQHRGQRA